MPFLQIILLTICCIQVKKLTIKSQNKAGKERRGREIPIYTVGQDFSVNARTVTSNALFKHAHTCRHRHVH